MRRAAVFVLSDVRSGSTLLDLCLGAHPGVVSLGEVHWLAAYLAQDRTEYDPIHPLVCTCGKPVSDCLFWAKVAVSLGRPLESLQLRPTYAARKNQSDLRAKIRHLPRRLLRVVPRAHRNRLVQRLFEGPRIARDCVDLFDAVSDATGRRYCVDSSKSAFRFRTVYELEPTRTLAIVLVRDYRAVVHSKMKRGLALEAAAGGWRTKMRQIEALTGDLPANCVHVLKYESLCESPRDELARLCGFLGIEFVEAMLRRPTDNIHHIGGSPSKFDSSRYEISLDRAYEGYFEKDALKQLRKLVGDVADKWGY